MRSFFSKRTLIVLLSVLSAVLSAAVFLWFFYSRSALPTVNDFVTKKIPFQQDFPFGVNEAGGHEFLCKVRSTQLENKMLVNNADSHIILQSSLRCYFIDQQNTVQDVLIPMMIVNEEKKLTWIAGKGTFNGSGFDDAAKLKLKEGYKVGEYVWIVFDHDLKTYQEGSQYSMAETFGEWILANQTSDHLKSFIESGDTSTLSKLNSLPFIIPWTVPDGSLPY
ncbi:MAG: hypothetical protein ABI425_04690 [Patescibacteria group bacterium]